MAEINNVIAEASQDLQTIEDFVNLPADSEVYPRLLPSVNVGTLAGTRDAIFRAGGLPAEPFATKAQMETDGTSLADGQLAQVYNEAANNGLYVKTAGAWVKSAYDPVLSANTTMQNTLRYGISPENLGLLPSTGLSPQVTYYDGLSKIWIDRNKYVNDTGGITALQNSLLSDYLAAGKGDLVTIESSFLYGISTYDKDKNFIATFGSPNTTELKHTISNDAVRYIRVAVSKEIGYTQNFSIQRGYKELPWLKTTTDNMISSLKDIFNAVEVAGDNMLTGVIFTDGYYLDLDGVPQILGSYSYSDFVPVVAGENYVISLASTFAGIWYDEDKNILASIPAGTGPGTIDHRVTAPVGAAFVRVNISSTDPVKSMISANDIKLVIPSEGVINTTPMSNWMNKKIAWYGTSIPAGYPHQTPIAQQDVWSHANLAVHDLGAEIINKAVPAGGVKSTLATNLSFTNLAGATNYQNALIDLFGTANDPDLVVFDYGVNDYPTTDDTHLLAFDPKDPYDLLGTGKSKISDMDAATFIGAYNTIVTAMLTAKPTQKFCFITHFSDDYTQGMNFFKLLNETIEALALHWQAPVLRLHRKTNYRTRHGFDSINPAMPDNIHPASGDGSSVQSLRAIMRDFLISIG